MGVLKKFFFVENEGPEPVEQLLEQQEEKEPEPEIEVDADIQSAENIVEEIYIQNNLTDGSTSIFTVQKLIQTLPEEMATATQQTTVAGILEVSGIQICDLIRNASTRTDVLRAAESQIVAERTAEIEEAKADIEMLKKTIEAANVKIKKAEDIIAAAQTSINKEVKVISELMNFCIEMEGKNK